MATGWWREPTYRVGDEEGRGAAGFVAALNPRSAGEDYQVVMSYGASTSSLTDR